MFVVLLFASLVIVKAGSLVDVLVVFSLMYPLFTNVVKPAMELPEITRQATTAASALTKIFFPLRFSFEAALEQNSAVLWRKAVPNCKSAESVAWRNDNYFPASRCSFGVTVPAIISVLVFIHILICSLINFLFIIVCKWIIHTIISFLSFSFAVILLCMCYVKKM